jgi:hypothetical protein
MYADPITVTVAAVPVDLPRVFQPVGGGPSLFIAPDESLKVEISHQVVGGRRERHLLKVSKKALTPDPFDSSRINESTCSAYVVIDNPKFGFSDAELGEVAQGLIDFLDVPDNLSKLIGGEA